MASLQHHFTTWCRKFRVTAVESNAALLAKAHTQALECGVTINSISAAKVHKKVAQQGGVASLVTIMHGIHLVDTDLALEECHRLLKPDGFLALAWNDRCATFTTACDLTACVCTSRGDVQLHCSEVTISFDIWIC